MICKTCLIRVAVKNAADCKHCRKNAARSVRVKCSNCGEPGGPGAAFDACQFKGSLCPDCFSVPAAPAMEAR